MRQQFVMVSMLALVGACACTNPGASIVGDAQPLASSVAPEQYPPARSSAWLTEIEHDGAPLGAGAIEVASLDGAPQWLELEALRVDVHAAGTMARYEVEHVFHNPSDRQLEGTFRFPLPSGSIVTGLAMEIDGKLMDGEMLERGRAREIYEEIVDSMRDPALLEWEAGQTFKLRVFPIQPGEHKRVIMRYMAPLRVDERAAGGFSIVIPSAVPAMQTAIPSLTVTLDGKPHTALTDHDARENLSSGHPSAQSPGPSRDALTIPLAAAHVPAYVEELDAAGASREGWTAEGEQAGTPWRYLAARVELDWSKVAPPQTTAAASGPRRTIIVVDSSRSALESWPLAQEAVAALLERLDADAPFMLIAADLDARVFEGGYVGNDASSRAAALAFLAGIEPDGASDLGRVLTHVGEVLAREPAQAGGIDQVVYIGDGTPTWGVTEREQLRQRAATALGDTPLYALSLGKHESRDVLEAIAGATAGRVSAPESPAQLAAFSRFIEQAPSARRLANVEVVVPGIETLHAPSSETWFEGEAPVVLFRIEDGDRAVPTELLVRGRANGQPFEQRISLGEPEAALGVRQQWVARELTRLSDKAERVELSVAHSVLSKDTALLVLESEEAYERYAIERRNGPAADQGDPTITGRNLEGDESPYLGPGDLQPGDPEIHIPAPRDAVSVEVVFPFGESKAARWEQELGQWTVRFLVDDDTEPGTYAVLVRVTHADGRVELMELEYTIDIEAPLLRLELRARDDGAFDVLAHQVLSDADAARERIEGMRGEEQAQTLDAKRVELIMPDGQTLTLREGVAGSFVRRWAPRSAVQWPATVTAVVGDRALNSRRMELTLDGPEVGR